MSVRKAFCEVTDFNGDTLALTRAQACHVEHVYWFAAEGISVKIGGGLRACRDGRVGVVVRKNGSERFWVVKPRDVTSITRMLAKAGTP